MLILEPLEIPLESDAGTLPEEKNSAMKFVFS
jgi:hypothetical protein